MQNTACGQCGASWTSPDMLTEALRGSIASWARAGKHIMATQQMTTVAALTPHDAMAIVLHITHEPGTCHYCSYPLTGHQGNYRPLSILPGCQL